MQGTGFDPWSGKIPHAEGQLSCIAQLLKSTLSHACALQQKKPPQREARTPQLEKDWAATKTQHSQEEIGKFICSFMTFLYFQWQKRVMTEHEGKVGNESQEKSKATCPK